MRSISYRYRLDYLATGRVAEPGLIHHHYECHGRGWPDHVKYLDADDNLIIWIEGL